MADRWEPNPGPQARFLASGAFEALYGGAAGGGKTDALTVAPLRWVEHPRFAALILRRTFPDLERTLIRRSRQIYPSGGATYNDGKHVWRFPSGAEIHFGYLEAESDVEQYQGAEFQFIGLDELTHFSESQYRYMISRCRGPAELPKQIRATTNPGGPGHDWVQRRWGAWLGGPDFEGQRGAPGESIWYRAHEHDEGEDVAEPASERSYSRTFIPARVEDNPKGDPTYRDRLSMLDPVTRRQLRDGDWLIRPAAGLYFRREWFEFVDAVPDDARRVSYWDLAATEEILASTGRPKNDPDWTVRVRLALTKGADLFVEDVVRFRAGPGETAARMRATAEADGRRCRIRLPQDPGAAGKIAAEALIRMLDGFTVDAEPETGDKTVRAGPFSTRCEVGARDPARRVRIVRGAWNAAFLTELEAFPTRGVHDDQVDGASGAFTMLTMRDSDLEHTRRLLHMGR